MKRSGFPRAVYERRPRVLPVPVPGLFRLGEVSEARSPLPKGEKARPGKCSRTVEEQRWIDAALAYGCVACVADGMPSRPPAYHHLLRGGRRMGHLFGYGLCDPGHHQDGASLGLVSRHPWKARFEKRYGKETDILARLKVDLGFFDAAEYTK